MSAAVKRNISLQCDQLLVGPAVRSMSSCQQCEQQSVEGAAVSTRSEQCEQDSAVLVAVSSVSNSQQCEHLSIEGTAISRRNSQQCEQLSAA